MIKRILYEKVKLHLFKGKVLILTGPRQVGKTELSKKLAEEFNAAYYNCELDEVKVLLISNYKSRLERLIPASKFIIFDEAQDIPEIGKKLKIFHDEFPEVQIIATGSSSFDLLDRSSESLTGRSREFKLFPLGIEEMISADGVLSLNPNIENVLRFGSLPEVYNIKNENEKIELLKNISSGALFKDTLKFNELRKPDLIKKLLTLLALQIGQEVSLNKLSNATNVAISTVEKYLDVLEKSYIIISLSSFSRNLAKEISKSKKYYFLDLGIRNAILNNFNALELRNDIGQLWENFAIVERMKHHEYQRIFKNYYFWRTYDQQEIDLIEEYGGKLECFEFKWNSSKAKFPKVFLTNYENSSFKVINQKDALDLVE